jgi:uroporphyrinogen-III synthase
VNANMNAGPLAGRGIVVTRPGRQAVTLVEALAALGARPLMFPTLIILAPDDPAPLAAAIAHLASYDFAVFVSANAAEHVLAGVSAWPAGTRAIAPGPGTAAAVMAGGVANVLLPATSYDSEGLLALPELGTVAGKRFVIFRGDGGRELLGDTLAARGAHVDYVSCYRRAKPTSGAQALTDAWDAQRIDAVTVTSSEGLENLWELLDTAGRERLRATPLFAPHARIAARGRALGVREVIETAAGDAGLIAGLLRRFSSGHDSEQTR